MVQDEGRSPSLAGSAFSSLREHLRNTAHRALPPLQRWGGVGKVGQHPERARASLTPDNHTFEVRVVTEQTQNI